MRKVIDERVRRRGLLKTVGACAAVGAATATGCFGDGNGGNGGDEEPEDGGDSGDTQETGENESADEPGRKEASLDEPAEFPEEAGCPVCNMVPAEFPDWNAQVAHEDGERAYTCSAGCVVAYVAYPEEFAVSDTGLAGAWVTEFETGELIDGTEAHYALETKEERVDDVMGKNPAPFEKREGAVAYVDEVDYLGEDDIVRFEDFDKETADMYRGQLTPEEAA